MCEQYVMGMLTNVDTGLALDRIHNMLRMFMVDPPYNRSQVATYDLWAARSDPLDVCIAGNLNYTGLQGHPLNICFAASQMAPCQG